MSAISTCCGAQMRWGDYGGYNSDCFYLHLSRCRCAASKASGDTPRDDVQPYTPQEYTPKYDTRQTPQDDIQLCYLRHTAFSERAQIHAWKQNKTLSILPIQATHKMPPGSYQVFKTKLKGAGSMLPARELYQS